MSWHSTEWHQFMAMAAYEYYMQTGDTQLASSFWDLLVLATYSHCADKSVSASGLVDFTHCSRDSSFWPTTRDNIDWPMNSRDGYVNTNRSTEVNAFMCALESAEREREREGERETGCPPRRFACSLTLRSPAQGVLISKACAAW